MNPADLARRVAVPARLVTALGRFFAMAIDERYARRVRGLRGREVNQLIHHGLAERREVNGRRFLFLTRTGLDVRARRGDAVPSPSAPAAPCPSPEMGEGR